MWTDWVIDCQWKKKKTYLTHIFEMERNSKLEAERGKGMPTGQLKKL